MALAAAVLFLPALSSPARADCQPTAATGGTVNCTTTGGTQTTTVGTAAEDNVTVTVQPGATVNVSGANAIDLHDGNTVTNAGTIIVDTGSAISVNNNNTITNNGTIIATGGAFGIDAFNGNTIINNGTIRVDDNGAAINVCCDNVVINNGNIIGGENTVGILAGDRTNMTNSGTITVGGNGSFGMLTTGDGFIGPGNATITNKGTIITGGDGSTGIGAETNYNIVNTGTILVGDNNAAGIKVDGGNSITNAGLIRAGVNSFGVQFNAFGDTTPNTLTNSGSIIAPFGAAIFGTDNNTVINNGYVQGPVLLINAGNTFTNNGYLIAGDPGSYAGPGGIFVAGMLTNSATGTFAIRADPTSSDAFVASTIQLDGRLQMVVTPGLYNPTTTYSQVIALCGCGTTLTGTFASVVSSSPFFTATADYSIAGEVDVTLNRIGFGSVPRLTKNQTAVGNYLEGGYSTSLTGNAATFYSNLLAATSAGVLDNLSGEGISGAQNAAFTAGGLFNNTMQTQGLFGSDLGGNSVVVPPAQYAATRVAAGHEAFASLNLNKAPAPAQQPGSLRIWTAAFGATQSLQGQADPGSSTQSVRSGGGVLGADWQAAWDLRVGVAVGGSESTFSVANLSTSGRMTGGHIGAYAMKSWGAYYAMASLSYARFDNSTTRLITGVGPTEAASGRFNSDQFSARFELGWKQAYGGINVTPFVAVEPAVLWQRGFTESGTILGLTVDSRTATSLPTFVGVQVDGRMLTPDGAVFAPYSRLSWVHEFQPDRRVTSTFITVPGATFTVDGARAASDAARLDTGGKLIFPGGYSLFANFSGEWSDRTESYAATGGFRAAW